MKAASPRRQAPSQGCLAAPRRPPPEATVVRHFHPSCPRKPAADFPEVKCFLPRGSKYIHMHPVFKFVDSFLSSTSVPNYAAPAGGRRPRRCGCPRPDCGDVPPSGPLSPRRAGRQDRVQANLTSVGSKSSVRMSLRSCAPQAHQAAMTADRYMRHLKSEIANKKVRFCCAPENSEVNYAERLKREIATSRAKCLDDAKNVINELKNEIVSYRLGGKEKYSSSCSDICDKEKHHVSPPLQVACGKPAEKPPSAPITETCEQPRGDSPKKDIAGRCETLWLSKESFVSSTDTETTQTVNFELKLEEANNLIDKVRRALKDIGKGYKHVGEMMIHLGVEEPAVESPKGGAEMCCSEESSAPTPRKLAEDEEEMLVPICLCDDPNAPDISASPGVELLKEKLKDISEGSTESDVAYEQKEIYHRVERATSPILLRLCSASERTPPPGRKKSASSEDSGRMSCPTKQRNLQMQTMPSVSIRAGLVVQQTLKFCIMPSGSVTNEFPMRHNVCYQEISTETRETPQEETAIGEDVDEKSTSSASVRAFSRQIAESIREEAFNRMAQLETEAASASGESVVTTARTKKSPFEIGFYQTKSTQCNESSLDELQTEFLTLVRPTSIVQNEFLQDPLMVSKISTESDSGSFYEVPVKESAMAADMADILSVLMLDNREKAPANYSTSLRQAPSDFSELFPRRSIGIREAPDQYRKRSITSYRSTAVTTSSSSSGTKDRKQKPKVADASPNTDTGSQYSSNTSSNGKGSGSSLNVYGSEQHLKKKKTGSKRKRSKSEETEERKEEKSEAVDGGKTDKNLQVSLSSSESGESLRKRDVSKDRSNVACFIKGLTGTSQADLDKIRSDHGIARSKESDEEAEEERQVEVHKYGDNPDEDGGSTLSERSKQKRLREFQKMMRRDGGGAHDVMTALVERNPFDEVGGRNPGRRSFPFRRGVLGSSDPLFVSHGEGKAAEESVSEGEIKSAGASSVGEVRPFKYDHFKTREATGARRQLPENLQRKDGDKSGRIARQRTQYNSWVTYHLQKHHKFPFDDSSNSTGDGSRK